MGNVYDMVTERILKQMEQGVIPWQKSWMTVCDGAYNRISKKSYSLINQLMLMHHGEYATFKQWKELGGTIRKGEKAEQVVFWKMQEAEEEKNGEIIKKTVPLLRYYNVFHISQVDGVESEMVNKLIEHDGIKEAEDVKNNYAKREQLEIKEIITDKACYIPQLDQISMPCKEQFSDIKKFYSTLFHEMVHSTGHVKRLNRIDRTAFFGSEAYSKEELVAQMGSSLLCYLLGYENTDTINNDVNYIRGWLAHLKDNTRELVSAGALAQRAVDYVMNTVYQTA